MKIISFFFPTLMKPKCHRIPGMTQLLYKYLNILVDILITMVVIYLRVIFKAGKLAFILKK